MQKHMFYIKRTPTQVFSCEICKIFRNTYFREHLSKTAHVYNGTIFLCTMVTSKDQFGPQHKYLDAVLDE